MEFIHEKEHQLQTLFKTMYGLFSKSLKSKNLSYSSIGREIHQLLHDFIQLWYKITPYVKLNVVKTDLPDVVYSHCMQLKVKIDTHIANILLLVNFFTILKRVGPQGSYRQFVFTYLQELES